MRGMMQLRQQGAFNSAQQQLPQQGQQGDRFRSTLWPNTRSSSRSTRRSNIIAAAAGGQQSLARCQCRCAVQGCSQDYALASDWIWLRCTCLLSCKPSCSVQSFDVRSSRFRGVERFGGSADGSGTAHPNPQHSFRWAFICPELPAVTCAGYLSTSCVSALRAGLTLLAGMKLYRCLLTLVRRAS